MRTAKFSYFQSLRFAWETWKHNVWFLIGITFLFLIIAFLPSLIAGFLFEVPSSNSAYVVLQIFAVLLYLAGYILQIIMGIGLIKIFLNFCDQKKSTVGDLFRVQGIFWRYVGGVILYGLLILAGTILLIVPGIYWALRYMFVPYLLIDKKMRIGEAFRQSSALTKNTKWNFILFSVFLGLLNLSYLVGFLMMFFGGLALFGNIVLGIVLLVIGFILILAALFITMPIMWLAYTHAYRTIAYTTQAGFDADRQKGVAVSSGEHATKVATVVVFILGILLSIALAGWSVMRFKNMSSQYPVYPLTDYRDLTDDSYYTGDGPQAPDLNDYMLEDGTVDAEAYRAAFEAFYGPDSANGSVPADSYYPEEVPVEVQ